MSAQGLLRRSGARVARLDRRPLPHWVILRALPVAIAQRFDSSRARDLEASFELRVLDPRGGEPARFELLIEDGRCQVRPGPARSPGAVATIGADDMIRLASGVTGWPQLLSRGRLELTGDPFLALRFPSLFRLPPAAHGSTPSVRMKV